MALPLLPLLIGATLGGGVSQVSRSIIGQPLEWLANEFDPKISVAPNTLSNNAISDYNEGLYRFQMQIIAPTNKDILALDSFFESYGYRVDTFKIPNLSVRNTFTYVKCRDAQVTSSNMQAANQMSAMLNGGCKWWKGEIGK